MKPTSERAQELASRLMDGSLTPSEERELGEALNASREVRDLMRSYFRIEGAIADLARVGLVSRSGVTGSGSGTWRRRRSGIRPSPAPTPAPSRQAAWGAGLLAAAGLLGLLYLAVGREATSPSPAIGSAAKSLRPESESSPLVPPHVEDGLPPLDPQGKPAPARPEIPGNARPPQPESPSAPTPSSPARSDPPPVALPSPVPEQKDPPAPAETVVAEVTVERVEGEVVLTGPGGSKTARPGDPVAPGQGLETGSGKALAVLTFPDGTRLEARSETSIRDIQQVGPSSAPRDARGGKSLFIQRGSVWAHVRPQPADRPFVLGTPRGEARVLGTILTLRVDADPKGAVRLDVQEGKVRFTRPQDARSVDVPAGHSVSSTASSDLVLLRSTEVLTSFQDGAAPTPDYLGTKDTFISEKNAQSNFGHAKSLVAEGEDLHGKHKAQWLLLRWDLSAIPTGSRVRSASISLTVTAPSQSSPFYLYEPARAWSETEATWKLAAAGSPWRFPGSLGLAEKWGPASGTLVPLVKGEYTCVLNETGVALVQSWVNAPPSNLGFVMASPDSVAALHINSREAQPPETRPKLTVIYLPRR